MNCIFYFDSDSFSEHDSSFEIVGSLFQEYDDIPNEEPPPDATELRSNFRSYYNLESGGNGLEIDMKYLTFRDYNQ